MSDHKERMKQEYKDLKSKIDNLESFIFTNDIFKSLSDTDKANMIKQLGFMESYLSILNVRIFTA